MSALTSQLLRDLGSSNKDVRIRALDGLKEKAARGQLDEAATGKWLEALNDFRQKFEASKGQEYAEEYHMSLAYIGCTHDPAVYDFLAEFIRQQPSDILTSVELNAAADGLANTGVHEAYEILQWYMGTYTALSDSVSSLWRMVANLGKVGTEENVEEICSYLQHADKGIRTVAAQALEQIGKVSPEGFEPFEALQARLGVEVDSGAAAAMLRAMGETPDQRSHEYLQRHVVELSGKVQRHEKSDSELQDYELELRAAVEALGDNLAKMGDRVSPKARSSIAESLAPLLTDGGKLGVEVAATMSFLRVKEALKPLIRALEFSPTVSSHHVRKRGAAEHGPERVLDWASVGLIRIGDNVAIEPLLRQIKSRNITKAATSHEVYRHTGYIAEALAHFGAKEAEPHLAIALLRMHLKPWGKRQAPPPGLVEKYAVALNNLRKSNTYSSHVLESKEADVFQGHLSVLKHPHNTDDLALVLDAFAHDQVLADLGDRRAAVIKAVLAEASGNRDANSRRLYLRYFQRNMIHTLNFGSFDADTRAEVLSALLSHVKSKDLSRAAAEALVSQWSSLSVTEKSQVVKALEHALSASSDVAGPARQALENMGLRLDKSEETKEKSKIPKALKDATRLLDNGQESFPVENGSQKSKCVVC